MLCKYCGTAGKVYKQRNGNGAYVVVERCPRCRCNTVPGKPFLNKAEYNLDALPLFDDYTKQSEPCSVKGCENRDTELHHFAPRSLFPDADNWLTGWLCKAHHALWHKLTLTGSYAPKTVHAKKEQPWQRPH